MFGFSRIQLLMNEYVAPNIQISYERTLLKLPNRATVSVDWAKPEANGYQAAVKRRVCCVFPGMGGGSQRGYVRSLVKSLLESGYEVAVLHIIGTGETPYTSAHYADFSSNLELQTCLDFVMKNAQDVDIVGIGLSMGAN